MKLIILHLNFSTYFLVEAISKVIIDPTKPIKSEQLITEACSILGIDIGSINFVKSHKRLSNPKSELEWEISEYRNYLTHFNSGAYNFDIIAKEQIKMIDLSRKLIFGYINKDFINWSHP